MTDTRIILASSSRYRQQQMAQLGLNVECIAANIDEQRLLDEQPEALSRRLAEAKAQKIATQHPDALIIGCDQVAALSPILGHPQIILGKPGSKDKAVEQLLLCSNQPVTFYSAISVVWQQRSLVEVEPTTVYFRELSETQIRRYVDLDNPIDCAGSFKVEQRGALLFERIESRDPNALIGLPVMALNKMLQACGIDLLAASE